MSVVIAIWLSTTLLSVFAAKFASDDFGVSPLVLSLVQFSTAAILLLILSHALQSPLKRLHAALALQLGLIATGVFLRETLKFAAVTSVGINPFNAIKALGPAVLVALDGLVFANWPTKKVATLAPLATLALGGIVMGVDALSASPFSRRDTIAGCVCALLSTGVEVGATLGMKAVLRTTDLDDASAQFYTSSFSIAFALLNLLLESPASPSASPAPAAAAATAVSYAGMAFTLALSALLSFTSTQMSIKALRAVSATQYTILDTLRRLVSSVLAVFVFGERIGTLGAVGLGVSLTGVYMYDRLERSASSHHSTTAPPSMSSKWASSASFVLPSFIGDATPFVSKTTEAKKTAAAMDDTCSRSHMYASSFSPIPTTAPVSSASMYDAPHSSPLSVRVEPARLPELYVPEPWFDTPSKDEKQPLMQSMPSSPTSVFAAPLYSVPLHASTAA